MAKKLRWSIKVRNSRKNIFEYWNYRNKSKLYRNKLNRLFNESLKIIVSLPEFGHLTVEEIIKCIIVSHFEVFYKITPNEITVLEFWDIRQNPQDFPIK